MDKTEKAKNLLTDKTCDTCWLKSRVREGKCHLRFPTYEVLPSANTCGDWNKDEDDQN